MKATKKAEVGKAVLADGHPPSSNFGATGQAGKADGCKAFEDENEDEEDLQSATNARRVSPVSAGEEEVLAYGHQKTKRKIWGMQSLGNQGSSGYVRLC